MPTLDGPAEMEGVNEWIAVVRRARLGRTTKFVALMLATYADADGSKVFPGVARLVVQCEISYSSARAALADLRQAGLIERVRQGNRRRGKSDEYRLTVSADLLERVNVPDPDEERAAIALVQEMNASAAARRQQTPEQKAKRAKRRPTVDDLRQPESVEAGDDLRQPTGAEPTDLRQPESVEDERSTPEPTGVETVIYASGLELSTPATDHPPSIGPLKERHPPSPVVAAGAQPQDAREDPPLTGAALARAALAAGLQHRDDDDMVGAVQLVTDVLGAEAS